ncbi:MAG: glycosyltransferase [Bryobacteraceae bacterium]|nr:glycosyltransferase [Bryobacteraceae bacterium]
MPELSVVLPVFRTAEFVDDLYRRLAFTLETQAQSFELIFVNDACPEDSGRRIDQLAAFDSRVVAIHNPVNLGQRRSVMKGLAASRGAVVIVMDADLQDEPETIPVLLHVLRKGRAEAVFAGRRGRYQPRRRMLTSRLFRRLMRITMGVPADAGSFVAITRRMADAILALPATERPYMQALIGATGLPVLSIPIERAQRPRGSSAYSDWARFRFALSGLRAALELRWMKWTAN